jgi:hypothetical protein
MPAARKTKRIRKDRAQDLLNEMIKLREQKEKFGAVDLSSIKDWKLAERVARSLLSDAGLDISNKRHVQLFLVMVAAHLHLSFEPGTRSKKIPIDNFTLLNMACASFQAGECETAAAISRKMHEDADLNEIKFNTLRMQVRRIVIQAVDGTLNLRGVQATKLAALMPTLKKIRTAGSRAKQQTR